MFCISAAITRNKPIDGHPVEGETVHREVFLEPTMFDIEVIWEVRGTGEGREGGGGIPAPVHIYYTPNAHTDNGKTDERNLIPGLKGSSVWSLSFERVTGSPESTAALITLPKVIGVAWFLSGAPEPGKNPFRGNCKT